MFALGCLPPVRSGADPAFLPASPKLEGYVSMMWVMVREPGGWVTQEGQFHGSQWQLFSLLAGFAVSDDP